MLKENYPEESMLSIIRFEGIIEDTSVIELIIHEIKDAEQKTSGKTRRNLKQEPIVFITPKKGPSKDISLVTIIFRHIPKYFESRFITNIKVLLVNNLVKFKNFSIKNPYKGIFIRERFDSFI